MTRGLFAWFPVAVVAYVCVAALRATAGSPLAWLAALVLPLLVSETWRRTRAPARGEDPRNATRRTAARTAVLGAALWLAARAAPPGRAAFDAVATAGAGAAGVAALWSLARIGGPAALLAPPAAARSLDAAGFAAFAWGIALAIPGVRALVPDAALADPLAADYAVTSAATAQLLVALAASHRLRALRGLELAVADRASGALALCLAAFAVAVPAAAFHVATPDRVVPATVIVVSLALVWVATTAEPSRIAAAQRGLLAVMIVGVPVAVLGAWAARALPERASAIVLVVGALGIGAGLVARAVARPLAPAQSRWLDAIDAAAHAALEPEPDAATRAVLAALSRTSSLPGSRPELWQLHPAEVRSVDIAGYLHVEHTEAPARLVEIGLDEPERTVRIEALRACEVRRPDVRPLIAWFASRDVLCATIIVGPDGPMGFLTMPRGTRRAQLALEEARALSNLSDRLSALIAVSSALARGRARELAAQAEADRLASERDGLERRIDSASTRWLLEAERAARPAQRAAYSPAARSALETLQRRARRETQLSLVVPHGVDGAAWAAVVHLASGRRGPLVLADGALPAEQDAALWTDRERSPALLAEGGTLFVASFGALPDAAQGEIVRAASRSTSLGVVYGLSPAGTSVPPPTPRGAPEHPVLLPTLAERAEDLRPLCLDLLAHEGLARSGVPLGLDTAALAMLLEHDWPGNDAELRAVIERAAREARGTTLTSHDLVRAAFHPTPALDPSHTPLPPVTRRRARGPARRG